MYHVYIMNTYIYICTCIWIYIYIYIWCSLAAAAISVLVPLPKKGGQRLRRRPPLLKFMLDWLTSAGAYGKLYRSLTDCIFMPFH